MELAFDLKFNDLYENISHIDDVFIDYLRDVDNQLCDELKAERLKSSDDSSEKFNSILLIKLSPHLDDFISQLFNIRTETTALAKKHDDLAVFFTCRRLFVQRRIIKLTKGDDIAGYDSDKLRAELMGLFADCYKASTPPPAQILSSPPPPAGGVGGGVLPNHLEQFEDQYAINIMAWEDDPEKYQAQLLTAAKYANWAVNSDEGRLYHKDSFLFYKPKKIDYDNLVDVESSSDNDVVTKKIADSKLHQRSGFALTDDGATTKTALQDSHYCIYCHNQGKDSCSKGLFDKADKETGIAEFRKSPIGTTLTGCPLEEKISEMHHLKTKGFSLSALATVVIDNPMCAATGHRICNDCMKACVYQKQEPVNTPRVETRVLQDILDLPYGFEIYSLFTRWNPLNFARPYPKENSGYNVLVAGLGPAGFSLAHNLMNDGHNVTAIDGLKIEPLADDISGVKADGSKCEFKPIKNIKDLFEELDSRILAGFGGVAEYGITVRWNKNYLKIIRLLLERRKNFEMFGGVRFGSSITYDQAAAMGFDHIALAMGAGKPTVVRMKNAMARGVRTASDFLMSLQLTGAAKKNSIANLQVRLPVLVIGGGLTAIDTATESLAYYPVQVEKFLSRYETLCADLGEKTVRAKWSAEEAEIAQEFIDHGQAIRAEKELAVSENRTQDILSLLKKWGGVKLAYRRSLDQSPSYRLNHEEVEKALEEGIEFIENVTPVEVQLDKYAHAQALKVSYVGENSEQKYKNIPAKSIFMGAGTSPNTVLAREDSNHFSMDKDGWYFQAVDIDGNIVGPEKNISKPKDSYVLMALGSSGVGGGVNHNTSTFNPNNNISTSFFGDLHPTYVGNVVKAIASAKNGYPIVSKVLEKTKPALSTSGKTQSQFIAGLNHKLRATVEYVERLTHNIIEVVIKAPLAAENFNPGQFYRLQNFETLATVTEDKTVLAMEGLALTGAWVDREKGLISLIVLEMGGSSNLCANLKPNEPVILMGPTGEPTEITSNETVILVGGGLGNAVLFSIGKAFKDAGSKVIYFAGYKKKEDRYKVEEIEKASDVIIWCCDEGEFTPEREGDKSCHGNIVQAIEAYAKGDLGDVTLNIKDADRIITIGSDGMMNAVAQARHKQLKPYLKDGHIAIGSINSPMQCMMKEICAQCLQRHIDPQTGAEHYVYSCFNQDQNLDSVDFGHLRQRLIQNGVQEKLTSLWIEKS